MIARHFKSGMKIHFTDFWDYSPEHSFYYKLLNKYFNAVLSDKEPDIVFFSVFGEDNKKFAGKHVLIIGEPNDLSQFQYDYCIGHQYELRGKDNCLRWNMFAPRYPYLNVKRRGRFGLWDKSQLLERKFCNFIYSNAGFGKGAVLRQEFCRKLSEYKHVDCPGKVLNNMDPSCITPRQGAWVEGKLEFIRNYKFTIAFENESIAGYTTEKLWQCFYANSIPIYWGNPAVSDEVNSGALINCHEYDCDFDAVIKRVEQIDNDPDLYLHMLRRAPLKRGYRYGYGDLKKFVYKIGREVLKEKESTH